MKKLIASALAMAVLVSGAERLTAPINSQLPNQIVAAARTAEQEGNPAAALREYRRLLELYPNDPLVRAGVYAAMGDVADGIEGLSFNIEYDPAVVRAASDVTVTNVTARCMVVSNGRVPGVIQVAAACLEPLSGSGPLLTVRLIGRAAGTSDLRITGCNLNEGTVACTYVSGLGTVQTALEPPSAPAAPATLVQTSSLVP